MIRSDSPLKGLPLAVIDTETTGLAPGHIVEIAIVHLTLGDDEAPRLAYSTRVRPPLPIPSAASAIHGITDADVADAPTWADAWPRVAEAIADRVPVAHNAPFDAAFVTAECERIGVGVPGGKLWLCTQVPGRCADRYQSAKRLVDIAARRGIILDAHGAAGDAMAAALVGPGLWRQALRITGSAGDTAPMTYRDLLSWQHAEALRQERDFVEYLLRKGARGDRPETPWHDLLGVTPPAWPERPAVKATHRIGKDGHLEPLESP